MCQLVLLIVLLAVAAFAGAVTLAGIYFGAWGIVGTIVAFVLVGPIVAKVAGKAMLTRFAVGIFDKKSRVLRDAEAEIHSVAVSDAPSVDADVQMPGSEADGGDQAEDADESDDEEAKPAAKPGVGSADIARHYQIDVSIKPKAGAGPFQHWDIDDLTLVPFEFKVSRSPDDAEGPGSDLCEVRETRVWDGQAFVEPEGSKFNGPQRLRLLVSVKPEPGAGAARYPRRLKFRYYFEAFGDIALP